MGTGKQTLDDPSGGVLIAEIRRGVRGFVSLYGLRFLF